MIPQEIIRQKRNGGTLSAADIDAFIGALGRGELAESQIGAFAMAVWFRGMTREETVALTLAMARSGDALSWNGIGRPIADKHSTGGVGDNVSLMLAPIAAACGLAVPMISGRGLGHTGGTLDKLESIPGYGITPDAVRFRKVVDEVGCAIIGQTGALAPADGKLYAVRDVTATVDSAPLITASILSKKLAAGLETLVLDVKIGSGAFMTSQEEAETLARSLVEVANGGGVKTSALITDMNQPLADAAGNVVELQNCLDFLKGNKAGTRLETVVLAFAAEMLVQAGIAANAADAEGSARAAVTSGKAAEIFGRMVHGLGGPADLLEHPDRYLASAPVLKPVLAAVDGWLGACDARGIGMSVIDLGGGRRRPQDKIDHRVGFSNILPLGTRVSKGDRIATVHAADEASAERAAADLSANYRLVETPPALSPVIISRI
ncbi:MULTISPECIES: thymidine phosphorylase [unclassified Rhizobium]|uniref:thymidine phosphorylase n=1 Tax=unclassified Rhizobium TaxID=2613769 RepID=UPI00064775FE|nr:MULTISPECIES: thymidine phosphorylase [unclassified Rhizobium]MBN8953119.1 thymidine phosphorylase [Rhizobium tropici]OJY75757.1 MAG: thymidine phosphorylase [Rhizobium sp. 60-20]RKD75024.1 thymidine phosphorylase [Rhizobium sp. WW_1]